MVYNTHTFSSTPRHEQMSAAAKNAFELNGERDRGTSFMRRFSYAFLFAERFLVEDIPVPGLWGNRPY